MLIKNKPSWQISENLVTNEEIYLNRRQLFKVGLIAGASLLPFRSLAEELKYTKNGIFSVPDREITKESLATSYNNFYEFSLDKDEVAEKVKKWNLQSPWKIEIGGLKSGMKTMDVDQLTKLAGGLEERVYRFRCVEAWSMVVPWMGFPLGQLIKKLDPIKDAKFVKFQTFDDKKIGTNMSSLPYYPWPYTEGLSMDEALHPLTLLATGLYGKSLKKQNGAPIRLVVPWKYGFKSIKSITKIEFVKEQPKGLWENLASSEYGFTANVNPLKDHPRWSQATERVLDGKFLPTRIKTLMFNGYEKEVAALYKGVDLMKNF